MLTRIVEACITAAEIVNALLAAALGLFLLSLPFLALIAQAVIGGPVKPDDAEKP
jgi:hypothetical protein